MEAKLITAAADCNWRAKSFELFRDVVVLMRETGNLAAVMKTMGHKNVRTTMRYQHPELDIVRDALNATQTMTIQ